GCDIESTEEFARPSAGASAIRLDPDERHPDQALIGKCSFEHELMVAHQITVVAGEDNDRALGKPELIEAMENFSDPIIDHRDHPVSERNSLAGFLLAHRKRSGTVPLTCAVVARLD